MASVTPRRRQARGVGELRRDALVWVEPVNGGWCVRCRAWGEALMFRSGARAELQARALARCLASLVRDALVEIRDRRDTVVGTMHYFADEAGPAAPSPHTASAQVARS